MSCAACSANSLQKTITSGIKEVNMLWYIEYSAYGKRQHMGKIEAKSGNDAIKVLKSHVIGVNIIYGVWHDDDNDDE